MFDKDTTACFTGHRTYKGECEASLVEAIRNLYNEGYRTFLCGMAVGFDIAAAEAVLELRRELRGISLVAVVPFVGMESKFSEEDKERFYSIVEGADRTISLAPHYSAEVYAVRNNFLVDNASATIAYFYGSKGGTAYTVRRAVKSLHRYINICPSPQRELEF